MKPVKVNILGLEYQISYCEKPSDVDLYKRDSLWGQIDYWTRTIRIFDDGKRTSEDIFQTILHEILHGIASSLSLKLDEKDNHKELDILALAIADVLVRNQWVILTDSK